MTDKVWLGCNSGHYWFKVPDSYEEKKTDFKIDENGQKWRRMGNICWYTNLDTERRHEDMTLFRRYSPEVYPKYDNYDAIEVSKTADIPVDSLCRNISCCTYNIYDKAQPRTVFDCWSIE